MAKKKTPKKKGDAAKKVKTTSTARKTPGAKARQLGWTKAGADRSLEAAILKIMTTSTAAGPHTPHLLQSKLEARSKKPYSLDAVNEALRSLLAKGKIEQGLCYSIKVVAGPAGRAGMAAASPGSPTTHLRLDIEDFVRVALNQLPGGWVTPQQVKDQVDTIQPGFELEDIDIALEMLFRNGEIRKSGDGSSYCGHDCP